MPPGVSSVTVQPSGKFISPMDRLHIPANLPVERIFGVNKEFSPGITEKNTRYLSSLEPGTKEHNIALKQSGYANNIFRQAANAANDLEGFAYTSDDVLSDGPIYYKDWKGTYSGQTDDGTYLDVTNKKIIIEAIKIKTINIKKSEGADM